MTALPPPLDVIVSVLPALMVRSLNAKTSTAGPPLCGTLEVMLGGVWPAHHPVNECALESYVGLQSMVVAVNGAV
jgi:hypothetical protein